MSWVADSLLLHAGATAAAELLQPLSADGPLSQALRLQRARVGEAYAQAGLADTEPLQARLLMAFALAHPHPLRLTHLIRRGLPEVGLPKRVAYVALLGCQELRLVRVRRCQYLFLTALGRELLPLALRDANALH